MLISPRYLRDVFNVEPKIIAHVGAHSGEEAESYIELEWLNTYWFEANPSMFSDLTENPNVDNSKIIMCAVTDISNQKIHLNIASSSMSSSVFAFKKHSEIYPNIKMQRSIEVTTIRLDDFFKDFTPDFINLDIQGSELLALKGAESILKKVKWIYTEVSFKELYENGAKVGDIDIFLSSFGFIRSGTRRLLGEGWGDAIYINSNYFKLPFKNRITEKVNSATWIKSQITYRVRLFAHNLLRRNGKY
jgi:FkbM family methyltransferase